MSKNVTDRVILKEVYKTYYSDFCNFDKEKPSRDTKIYVPIDCELIAKNLNLDPEIIFGRLYYHLNQKHGYKQDDGTLVDLFAQKVGSDRHVVQFPLLSAVLAEHEQSYLRFTIPMYLSIIALSFSIAAYFNT